MKRAIDVAPFGELADPRVLAELAAAAEERGWAGFFVWDHIAYRAPVRAVADPWVSLAAVAGATGTVRIGPMVTPLSRRRVHKLARETVTLDILSSGLAAPSASGWAARAMASWSRSARSPIRASAPGGWTRAWPTWPGTGRVSSSRSRSSGPGSPSGWRGEWPNRRPLQRALRWDGYFPIGMPGPDALAELTAEIRQARPADDPFDVIVEIVPDEETGPWERAGATWAVTDFGMQPTRAAVLAVINDGP